MAILSKDHREPSELQKKILLEISREGSSSSLLSKNLEKKYPDVIDAIKILKDKKLIFSRDEKKGRGKKQIYYGLTDAGIKYLIEQQFSDKDFWKMIFFIYDVTTKHKEVTFTVDGLLEGHIKNKLKITEKTPFYFHYLLNFSEKISKEEHRSHIKVLKLFGKEGRISQIRIINKFSENGNANVMAIIDNALLENNFLYVYKIKNKIYYELSQFGLLYLLNFLKKDIDNRDNKELIDVVITKHKHLLPKIFGKWGNLRQKNESMFLLQILTRPFFKHFQFYIDDLKRADSIKITNALWTMEISKRKRMVDFIEAADLAFKEWKDNKKIKSEDTIWDLKPTLSKKEFLSITTILQKMIQIQKKLPLNIAALTHTGYETDEGYDEYEYYRDQISERTKDLISFQFYSLLRFNTDKTEWARISNADGFKEWYSDWMSAIIESEKENLESLNELMA